MLSCWNYGKSNFTYLPLSFSDHSFGSALVSSEFNEPLKPHSVFYNDTTGKLYLDEMKKKQFNEINPGGFYKGNVWAKAEICNPNHAQYSLSYWSVEVSSRLQATGYTCFRP